MMIKHESRWRKLILVLFIICMLGPWAFELLNVPAQYPCEKPSVRLTGDFCGYPFLGFEAFILAVSNLFYILRELIKGNFTPYVTEYLFLIYPWIMILPFFTSITNHKPDCMGVGLLDYFANICLTSKPGTG